MSKRARDNQDDKDDKEATVMPNFGILEPVSEQNPCGDDLRWDEEFLGLMDAFASAGAERAASIIDGELAVSTKRAFDEVVDRATALSARSKDTRILAARAEASWRQGGLTAFAPALKDLVAAQERWPDAHDGVHPRADGPDGDLGERIAAMGRLLNRVPALAATIGWGSPPGIAERRACADTLKDVFGAWDERLQDAFGGEPPSAKKAWREVQRLIEGDLPAGDQSNGEGPSESLAPATEIDAWDLIDQALRRMTDQDHHSPALPILRLLSTWRSLGIIEIVDRMHGSGVTLEQLMESVKRQL